MKRRDGYPNSGCLIFLFHFYFVHYYLPHVVDSKPSLHVLRFRHAAYHICRRRRQAPNARQFARQFVVERQKEREIEREREEGGREVQDGAVKVEGREHLARRGGGAAGRRGGVAAEGPSGEERMNI